MTQQLLAQAFDRIVGLPLTKTTRNAAVQFFHFGRAHYTTPQGLVLDIGELTLAVNCPWQLDLPDGQTVKHGEIYIRKREAGLPNPVWDWKKPGSSLSDQRLMEVTNDNPNLVVVRVAQHPGFTLTLYFSDSTTLNVQPDPATPADEYWQLFSNSGDGFKVGAGPQGLIS